MSVLKAARPVGVTLVVLWVLTAILWRMRVAGIAPHHPIFFYLLPVALVAIAYGGLPAVLCAAGAIACANFFLYNPLEWGNFIFFAVLALIGIKCTVELSRPTKRIPPT